ncbi:MAG: 2,4-dihydroxyhept-2-ene-1,7-dioic acid aldolase [Candidatus Marinimicrobia bacterium]|nr:2,4-dihydroxyhept-2-ene-1,7-dioic acid aldolase [Candidatus Neomarinimicrobiota bacterium]|tara:strand:+ start:8190 stop:8939 length:750 start_codon:yes stop_codon:yes gene_type:complete
MKNIKKRLKDRKTAIGSWITIPDPIIVEMMAKSKFDWLAVDLEHSAISISSLQNIIRIIDLSGVFPMVRLTSNDSDQIKRVMDAGAMGIIIPMIKNAKDVKKAINSIYYPPKGSRSVGLARAQDYGEGLQGYLTKLKSQAVIIIQIEHIDAVDNLEEIFSIKGIDGYLIGPNDLSASMGLPGEINHPRVKRKINYINKKAKEMNVSGGQHIIEADIKELKKALNSGTNFIGYSLDIKLFEKALREFKER